MLILQRICFIKTFANKNLLGKGLAKEKEHIIHLYLMKVQTTSFKSY